MPTTRRHFLQTSAAVAAAPQAKVSANDKIRIATIGVGGMGSGDTRYALQLPGTELVAVADIYDGRRERAKEVWGKQLFTTRDYREILARKDIDAVIVATPDHWHSRITIEALNSGKDVYCEKPMVHDVSEGPAVIEAMQKSGRILQIGSQYVSSMIFAKAGEVLRSGAIGELNLVEAWLDRNTAVGAWQYSIPPDASEASIDWDRFLGNAPKRAFEPKRMFRWRNYSDYGTGVAGDLYVHLLSGLHFATNSLGPTRIYSSGGVRYWKDGRDAADVVLSVFEYPKTAQHPGFTLALRVNLASGGVTESFGYRFVGSEGTMNVGMSSMTIARKPREEAPGYTIDTFPKAVQDKFLAKYRADYPRKAASIAGMQPETTEVFNTPAGYSMHLEHHRNFQNAVRTRKPFIEDGVFGYRAAGPALLSNVSMAEERACKWDPAAMKRV